MNETRAVKYEEFENQKKYKLIEFNNTRLEVHLYKI